MGREIEIKLRVNSLPALRRALKKLGARKLRPGMGRVHERNILFDTREGALRSRGELLRIREERAAKGREKQGKAQKVKLTFKGPIHGLGVSAGGDKHLWAHSVREEIEVEVGDAEVLARIFETRGMRPWFTYEKFRTTFRLGEKQRWAASLLVELDETPIGTFVELEGAPLAIDRAAKALGFSKREYITANYFDLYQEECRRRGVRPSDMVFAKAK